MKSATSSSLSTKSFFEKINEINESSSNKAHHLHQDQLYPSTLQRSSSSSSSSSSAPISLSPSSTSRNCFRQENDLDSISLKSSKFSIQSASSSSQSLPSSSTTITASQQSSLPKSPRSSLLNHLGSYIKETSISTSDDRTSFSSTTISSSSPSSLSPPLCSQSQQHSQSNQSSASQSSSPTSSLKSTPTNDDTKSMAAFHFSNLFRKPKRIRTAFSPGQLLRLEEIFEKNRYVVGCERKQLARDLHLSETQIKVWFQNRRTKHKREKHITRSNLSTLGSLSNPSAGVDLTTNPSGPYTQSTNPLIQFRSQAHRVDEFGSGKYFNSTQTLRSLSNDMERFDFSSIINGSSALNDSISIDNYLLKDQFDRRQSFLNNYKLINSSKVSTASISLSPLIPNQAIK